MSRRGILRAGPWTKRLLEPWADSASIRAELYGDEELARHAVSLADVQVVVRNSRPVVPLLKRVELNRRALTTCYEAVVADMAAGRAVSPAAEWLVDNFHSIEENIRQINKDLPRGYFAQLPKLGPGFLEGHPRIFGIVWGYVAHTDSNLDAERLARYIRAHERRKALTLGELWAVPIQLRIILIENARRLSEQIVEAGRQRTAADHSADLILGLDGSLPLDLERALPERQRTHPDLPFAVQLLRRLTEQPAEAAISWAQAALLGYGLDPEDAIQQEHQAQAQTTLSMHNIFRSLRTITDVNWEDWLESVSLIEAELRSSTGYAGLDFGTRNLCRTAIERLARGSGQDEIDIARAAIARAATAADELSKDVGFWLLDDGLTPFEHSLGYRSPVAERWTRALPRAGLAGYLGALLLTTSVLLTLGMWPVVGLSPGVGTGWLVLLGILAIIPASDLALGLVNHRVTTVMRASLLPGLALREGVPEDLRTLVVVPTMLTSPQWVAQLVETLEVHFHANNDGEIYVAAVTDWADSPTEHRENDDALLQLAVDGVRDLNARYGERFFLFHRSRRHNAAESTWMGWERKRGKLDELNRLLRGAKDTSYSTIEGRLPGPFRFVVTLDSDTILPRGAAKRLVAKLAHPLNRARFDPRTGRVARGYSILQPRVTPSLPPQEDTSFFQTIYSTLQGLDPYAFTVSDVYQDLFGEGSFAGKGIYDIDALSLALGDRIPQNAVLSHDLLEGNYARAALVTDVEVVEDHPTAYAAAAARTHRWTRGDWQLLPWILARHDGLSPLALWKMVDNLRRSLSPVCLVASLLVALAVLPVPAALLWTSALAAFFLVPPILSLVPALLRSAPETTTASKLKSLGSDLRAGTTRGGLDLTFLSHEAAMMVDAIARTLWRMIVSHHNLLEWTTAATAQQQAPTGARSYSRLMAGGYLAPVLALTIGGLRGPGHLVLAAVPGVLWLLAPLVAERVSRHYEPVDLAATPADLGFLRGIARSTWSYFEAFVTEAENHLPPDNFQEDPEPVIAHRTSPTNIGLYLLAVVSARDFGWIGIADTVDRLEATLCTLDRLEHHRGHLFNWYDTRTCLPLLPRYVSSVDSGNLAGHLLVVANACRDWSDDPQLDGVRVDGIADGVALIRQSFLDAASGIAPQQRSAVADALAAVDEAVEALVQTWPAGLDALNTTLADLSTLTAPTPGVWTLVEEIRRDVASLQRDAALDRDELDSLRGRAARVAESARRRFDAMDFSFLLDPRRGLLSVGLRVEEDRLEDACYDLLASECRLASFTAIAKGDVQARHWVRLGRPVTAAGGGAALLSWSGSMFEYLMPQLVMRSPATSLLSSTARRIVRRQIEYGDQHGLPWGVSESGYNARDPDHNYQYSPFGVPGLGIARRLGDDLVIAPYATGLAAMVRPSAAARNYRRLAALGARGRYGYYEALDYTGARLPEGTEFAIVRSFMAHHQGMTVVAIHNVIHNGLMRERFHREPIIRATQLLLQERAPREVPVTHAGTGDGQPASAMRASVAAVERTLVDAAALAPGLHLMSNGRLSLSLTPAGGGQLSWNGLAITRWRPDPTTGDTGDYLYLSDAETGALWSATAEPVRDPADTYTVRFAEDRARFSRRHRSIHTTLEHHLSPESDAVVRELSVHNLGPSSRQITVTSYAELVLAGADEDAAHPAFSKLFVHTEFLPETGTLIATRRRRSGSEPSVWAAHFVVVDRTGLAPGRLLGDPVPETDRRAFIGRNRSTRSPRWFDPGERTSASTGYVLDPVFSLGQEMEVPAGATVRLSYWTVVAATREDVLRLVDQHRTSEAQERVAMLGWTQSQIQLRHLGITPAEASQFQVLAGHVLFPARSMRAKTPPLVDAGPQSALWPLGISGDLPLVVVRIDDLANVRLAHQMVKAFEFWRLKRFAVDLVLLNERSTSYLQSLQQDLLTLAGGSHGAGSPDTLGRIFVVRRDQTEPATISVLIATAAVVLVARRGDLATQLARSAPVSLPPTSGRPATPAVARRDVDPGAGLLMFNGLGGFTPDGTEYVTVLDEGCSTPGPWTNVVANEEFGFHATAEGAGYTWWLNSRDNQLTPWRNDPVVTPVSEAIYVRDNATGQFGSPTAAPVGGGRHTARHGFGYSRYTHGMFGIGLDETVFVAPDDPVKLTLLVLTNRTRRRRSLSVTAYAELVLGPSAARPSRHVVTERDPQTGAILARNPWNTDFADQVVFFDLAGAQDCWTGDRKEFLGPHGTTEQPMAIFAGRRLSGSLGAGMDPCVALQRTIDLEPGATTEVLLVMGAGHNQEDVQDLVRRYRDLDPRTVLAEVRRRWQQRLSAVHVTTPSPAFDVMMNGWLLYQTLACRMLARSGYYQASGAYGFRDQLQDSMTVALVEPRLARAHILRAAGRQFLEGDVQHWWLPATGRGVRTRISDDVVWLPHAVCRYVRVTGDAGVLDEQVAFLEGDPLGDDETERFFEPRGSGASATLYDHCVLALTHAFARGRHGLPLIGTGDWNDGMNRVGARGEGESVWLGWFLTATLTDFAELARTRGDTEFASRCAQEKESLLASIEAAGWDGAWYRRGYFDDGTPLGSASQPEARIDVIAQSWAVLSGAADPERAAAAMAQVDAQLLMTDERLVRLFAPPFDRSEPDPGYIGAYPPGVRENGGQYTHGALWSVFAWAELGREDRAAATFELLNPVTHTLTPEAVETYRVEPYVVAADVYTAEPYIGRGGWTWYTGSAGWMYRAGIEAILGLHLEAGSIRFDPCLPAEWTSVAISYRFGKTTYQITVDAGCVLPRRVGRVVLDDVPQPGERVVLVDDGKSHSLRVEMQTRR